ncbi:polyprenol monophosphomannose synthase [Nakamurella flava]|uniref:polyprenol monophosphomannose synthase n=1 Tax=Nakamurella flava TaxID=2576308 RepID=UPI00197C2904|nr:polyprenol monophosphomannose synthase [Nakamurella flava]
MTSEHTAGRSADTAADRKVLVIIPTYQERENLPRILDRLLAAVPTTSVLVVDDGSPDGTGAYADERSAADERIHVLHRTEKAGLGAAYVAGFGWGLERGYDVLVEMDADGSHAPEQLPRLLGALDHADLVLGSRYVPGGSVVNWPKHREVLSRGGNIYSRLALGVHVHDITGGYRAFRAEVLRSFDLAAVESHGYCFQVDLAWRALNKGFRVVEVPITFTEREIGTSKMSGNIVREALLKVTVWGAQKRWSQMRSLVGRRSQPIAAPDSDQRSATH